MSGGAKPSDFTRIFIGLRSQSYGVASFREIGDALAHPDIRDKGIITNHMRDVVAMMEVIGRRFFGEPIDTVTASDIELVKKSISAQARLIGKEAAAELGIKPEKLHQTVRRALTKIDRYDGERLYSNTQYVSDIENKVVSHLMNTLQFTSALSIDDLLSDIRRVLLKNKYLSEDSAIDLTNAKNSLAAFIISHLHGLKMSVREDFIIDLRASLFAREFASVDATWPAPKVENSGFTFSMFHTDIKPSDICTDEVLTGNYLIDSPLELNEACRICLIN